MVIKLLLNSIFKPCYHPWRCSVILSTWDRYLHPKWSTLVRCVDCWRGPSSRKRTNLSKSRSTTKHLSAKIHTKDDINMLKEKQINQAHHLSIPSWQDWWFRTTRCSSQLSDWDRRRWASSSCSCSSCKVSSKRNSFRCLHFPRWTPSDELQTIPAVAPPVKTNKQL